MEIYIKSLPTRVIEIAVPVSEPESVLTPKTAKLKKGEEAQMQHSEHVSRSERGTETDRRRGPDLD